MRSRKIRTLNRTSIRIPLRALIALTLAMLSLGCAADQHLAEGAAHGARLVVTGQAEVVAAPDRAAFAATLTNSGRDADRVLDENAGQSAAMITALRGAGIDIQRLQTQGVRLNPEWTPRPRNASEAWRPEIIGYRATNRIEISTPDLARVGELLAVAVAAGANGIDGIAFTLDDDSDARGEAIRRATRKAMDEARIMAEAAGIGTGRVLELRLDHAQTLLPQPRMQGRMELAAAMDMNSVRAMPVEPGDIRVTASVTVTLSGD